MIKETYTFLPSKRKTWFAFQSEGVKGKIVKIVQFSLVNDGKWNLGFGDWNKGTVDDHVLTNNQDTMKVIRTIAKIVLDFFTEYPQITLVIEPVDEKRKRFYNLIFQRHYDDMKSQFNIIGLIEKRAEIYSPQKFYDSFEIFRKFES